MRYINKNMDKLKKWWKLSINKGEYNAWQVTPGIVCSSAAIGQGKSSWCEQQLLAGMRQSLVRIDWRVRTWHMDHHWWQPVGQCLRWSCHKGWKSSCWATVAKGLNGRTQHWVHLEWGSWCWGVPTWVRQMREVPICWADCTEWGHWSSPCCHWGLYKWALWWIATSNWEASKRESGVEMMVDTGLVSWSQIIWMSFVDTLAESLVKAWSFIVATAVMMALRELLWMELLPNCSLTSSSSPMNNGILALTSVSIVEDALMVKGVTFCFSADIVRCLGIKGLLVGDVFSYWMDAGSESMPLTGVAGGDIAEIDESHGKHKKMM